MPQFRQSFCREVEGFEDGGDDLSPVGGEHIAVGMGNLTHQFMSTLEAELEGDFCGE